MRTLSYRALAAMFVTILSFSLVACGGPPTWVKKGSAEFYKKEPKTLYGVGSVVGVRNEPLAWETAENRARADLLRTIQTYTAYLMRDYSASTEAGSFVHSAEEQNTERAIKTFAAATLTGIRSIDRYRDPKTEIYYVAMQMDLADLTAFLTESKELNSHVREFIRKNAERLFERLEQEEKKREVPSQ